MSAVPVVTLVRERIEVPAPIRRAGRVIPAYRWTEGFYVCNPANGARLYPPVVRHEAFDLARQLYPGCRVVIES